MSSGRGVGAETAEARTFSGVLDHSLTLARRHPRTVVAFTMLIVLPLALISLAVQLQAVGEDGVGDLVAGFDEDGDGFSVTLLVVTVLLSSLQVTLLAGALTPLVTGDVDPADGIGPLLRRFGRRLPSILAAWVLVKLLQAVSLLALVIGGAVVMVFCVFVTPIVVTTTPNPFRAIGSSFRLVSRTFGRTVGVVTLMIVVEALLSLSVIALPSIITTFTSWGPGPKLVSAVSVVSDLVTSAFVALATATLYVDARVRVEHLDLQRRFDDLGVPW